MTMLYDWATVPFACTLVEAGNVLGISRSAVYRLVDTGVLRSVRVSERKLVIPRAALRDFLGDRIEDTPTVPDEGAFAVNDDMPTTVSLEVSHV